MRLLNGATCLAAICAGVAIAAEPTVRLPDDRRPPVLDVVKLPDGATTIAISPDGLLAAVVVSRAEPRDIVRIFTAGETQRSNVEVRGRVVDLLFSDDGSQIYGLLHRPAKKHPGDTNLFRIDLATLKAHQELRVPPESHALAAWPGRASLLVACRDEVRTILLDGLRSGPLYRIPGANLSIAPVGGDVILLGQEERVVLVDLSDPPGRYEMPIRAEVGAPAPVVAMAMSHGGTEGLARVADGRIFRVGLGPLRLDAAGEGLLGSQPATNLAPPPPELTGVAPAEEPPAEPPTAEPPPTIAPVSAAVDETPATPAEEPRADETNALAADSQAEPPTAEPPPTIAAVAAPAAAVDETPATPTEEESPRPTAQLSGTISGTSGEISVVVSGPDNILREAARVTPDSEGRFEVDGLAPGRYRVTVDGGGDRVVVTEPRFHWVVLDGDSRSIVDFRLIHAF